MTTSPSPSLLDRAAVLTALYAGVRILAFGVDKVLGIGSSIEGFRQIGAGLGVDPTAFRYFVGVQELLVGLALVAGVVLLAPGRLARVQDLGRTGLRLGAPGLVATMLGAIGTELLVRPGEQDWLLHLALQLLVIGALLSAWTVGRFGLPRVGRTTTTTATAT